MQRENAHSELSHSTHQSIGIYRFGTYFNDRGYCVLAVMRNTAWGGVNEFREASASGVGGSGFSRNFQQVIDIKHLCNYNNSTREKIFPIK